MTDDRFALETKLVIIQAIKEMNSLKHPYIGSEHLMLGLLKKDEYIACLFAKYNFTYDVFKEKVINIMGVGKNAVESSEFTPLAQDIINSKEIWSDLQLDIPIVDNIMLLQAMLKEGQGVAFKIMLDSNVPVDEVYAELAQNNFQKEDEKEMEKIKMYYFYDCLLALSGNKISHVRKIPVFQVEDEVFESMKNNKVTLDENASNSIKFSTECFVKKGIENISAAIFISKGKVEKHIVVLFDDKENKLISKIKCFLDKDESRELTDFFDRAPTLTMMSIEDSVKCKNTIYSTDIILSAEMQKEKDEKVVKVKKQQNNKMSEQLKKFTCLINLNEYVKKHNTVVIGFDKELEQLTKGLIKMRKPNVVITGEPGVGKTALVEKLACTINDGIAPEWFNDKQIYQLSLADAVAGTKYRGEFEEKITGLLKILEDAPNIILFIDEIHNLTSAGDTTGESLNAGNIMKPVLARGNIRVIGATTSKEYESSIAKDGALERRFTRITVEEPSEKQVKEILYGVRDSFERFYDVTISNELLDELYNKSKRKSGLMPDIALDELELWCVDKYYEESLLLKNKKKECIK